MNQNQRNFLLANVGFNKFKLWVSIVALWGLVLCLPGMAQLAPTNKPPRVMVTWDPNPETDIGGYKIYHGTNSRFYTTITNVGNTTNAILGGFTRGRKYYFAATAYNTNALESDFSEEVSITIPLEPRNPTNIVILNVP